MTSSDPGKDVVKAARELAQAGRWVEAEDLLNQTLEREPDHIGALHLLASLAEHRGDLQLAAAILKRAVEAHPNVFLPHAHLSAVMRQLEDWSGSIFYGEKARALRPHDPVVLNDLAIAYNQAGEFERAEQLARQALVLQPRMAEPHNTLGLMAMQAGRLDEAVTHFETVLERKPADTAALGNLIAARTVRSNDDPHLKHLERRLASAETSERDRMQLSFAAAKAYTDLDRHEDALKSAMRACAIKRASLHYDEAAQLQYFDMIKSRATADLLRQLSGRGLRDRTPIFIISMPRSGSTLVEQIIASHPAAFGAGELLDFSEAVDEVVGGPNGLGRFLQQPDPAAPRRIGEAYMARIRRRSLAERVVDKMPSNYLMAGLIQLALPDAKIIHVSRNPVDTCVSCFTRHFPDALAYAYDLAELGRYYRAYHALMAHWRDVLAPHVLLDVQYEELVDDLETQARRILDHCELAWDPAVLSFHKTPRPVKTHSLAQVRQPLYRSAMGRWRGQERLLRPLLDALGDLAAP